MTLLTILALAGAMFLLAITPGPGVFATVARALASGFKHSCMVVAGIVIGDLIFLMFAIFGLSAIAQVMGDFFIFIKYLGGAYLIYLGLKLFFTKPSTINLEGVKELSWKANFFSGLFITLGNPKVILFYLGFLPTFVNLQSLTLLDITLIAAVVSIVLGGVMIGYAYMAIKAKNLFKNEKSEHILNRIAGTVMMTTGGVLISKA